MKKTKLKKADKEYLALFQGVHTAKGMKDVWGHSNSDDVDISTIEKVQQKWNKLFVEEVNSAQSSKDIMKIHKGNFYPVEINNRHRPSSHDWAGFRRMVLTKWNSLSLEEVKKITTSDEAYEHFLNAPLNLEAKRVAGQLLNVLTIKELDSITDSKVIHKVSKRHGLTKEIKNKIRIKKTEMLLVKLKQV